MKKILYLLLATVLYIGCSGKKSPAAINEMAYYHVSERKGGVDIERLPKYSSKDEAIEKEKSYIAESYAKKDSIFRELVNTKHLLASEQERFVRQAKIDAYSEVLSTRHFLISVFYQTPSDLSTLQGIIQQYGIDADEVKSYCEENSIVMSTYPLN
ncbi:MAG: hypothetical protein IJ640_00600 [Prevotella sp.]|nr:hypothetical protein [Prevotella sp.]